MESVSSTSFRNTTPGRHAAVNKTLSERPRLTPDPLPRRLEQLSRDFSEASIEESFSISAPHCGVKSLVLQTTAFPRPPPE